MEPVAARETARPAGGARKASSGEHRTERRRTPWLPGLLLGLGLGGFLDGILMHQVLQWHHLLTDTGEYPATTVAGQ